MSKRQQGLLPPPQSSGRSSNRRSQYSSPPTVQPVQQVQPQPPIYQKLPLAHSSPRKNHEHQQPLRVALPEEQSQKNKTTAHVKPFLSPNSKQGMGDVVAARDNWKPLTLGNGGNQSRDFLSEQRRQMAEIERLKTSRNTRSQSVMPPSGAARPTNHLEVNKMAQVN